MVLFSPMSDDKRATEDLRHEMAEIDLQILAAVERRAKLARGLGKLRPEGQPASLPADTARAIEALAARASGELSAESVREIFREIHGACASLELGLAVGYVGSVGGAAYLAAKKRFGRPTHLQAFATAADAIAATAARKVSFVVAPFETRDEGVVQKTLGALLETDLKIVATFDATPTLRLVGAGAATAAVRRVFVAIDDRAAARAILLGFPDAAVVDVPSSEEACMRAKAEGGEASAIADEAYAATFGLAPIDAASVPVEMPLERVRYAVIGARPSGRTGTDATSLAFAVSDSPGALLEVLRQFAERGVNLTKIQSRPTAGEGWGYLFFVELVGHTTDRNVVSALEDVKRQTRFFKLLGSYAAT